MMDIKRVDSEKLAKRAEVDVESIDRLVNGDVDPRTAREEVRRIGEILLTEDPADRMDRVLKALEIHTDLRNWRSSCDGGCCQWNIVTEIAYDPATEIR
jgi:hypothetical protein